MNTKYIEILEQFFIDKTDTIPIPCCIVEDTILEAIGYERGKKKEKLKDIQKTLYNYGLEITLYKHFIDNLSNYFPIISKSTLNKLEKRCKYKTALILSYKNLECKELCLDTLKLQIHKKLDKTHNFINNSTCLIELYTIDKSILNLNLELFYSRKPLIIVTNGQKLEYFVDRKTGMIYNYNSNISIGNVNYISLIEYILKMIDVDNLDIEYSKINTLFPIFNIENKIFSPYQLLDLNLLLDCYKKETIDSIEEHGIMAYLHIFPSTNYIVFRNMNEKIEF